MLNRPDAFARIATGLAQCARGDSSFGVLLVRLQRIHELNVLFGYALREQLEEAARAQLAAALRPVDSVLVIGSGEFLVLLPGLLSANHALLAAHRVVRAFETPLATAAGPVQAGVAVGASAFPKHGDSADLLCRRAEMAYAEALRRSERAALYTPSSEFTEISYYELRDALRQGLLEVHLQPILDLRRNRVAGVESLARWNSPRWGWVSPYLFVRLAEQTGLIGELSRWSLNATLRHLAGAQLAERGLTVSINLSPRLFAEPALAEQIVAALNLWDIPAANVILEVTEDAVMDDPQRSAKAMAQLHAAGLRIAIDDFGIGQSSFAYLRQFPASDLKIDQSFVLEMQRSERSAQLVRSMIELAHHLGMQVCAEGVADAATQRALAEMDCDFVQGFHIGRPQPAAAFLASLPEPVGAAIPL